MKRVILLIFCLFILVGCAKTNDEYRVETELERFKIK
jgi:PBP1b-binding outer membrane lipoprotein LpoB